MEGYILQMYKMILLILLQLLHLNIYANILEITCIVFLVLAAGIRTALQMHAF
jgi:hypothetical protein